MIRRLAQKFLLPALGIAFSAACQSGGSDSHSKSSGQSADAGAKCFSLVNGQLDTQGIYEAVVELRMGRSLCTGTFVSDNTLLTAAHCINTKAPGGGITALIKGEFVTPEKAIVPNIAPRTEREPKDDIAVVIFKDRTSAHKVGLSPFPPRVGQRITIVGYGQTDFLNNNYSDEKRRYGENTITGLPDDGATIKYELKVKSDGSPVDQDVMTGRGDSGGPLFLGRGLLGLVSRGEGAINNEKLIEYDTNLITPDMARFLRGTEGVGARIEGLDALTNAGSSFTGSRGGCS